MVETSLVKLEQLERLRSEIPPAAPWLPILVIHIRSQVKTTQSQSYKFKKIAKTSYVEILQETLHATHLLKLLDKMYKYEMDPTRTVEATERTRDAGRTDGRTDGRTEWNQYTPQQLRCAGGIKILQETLHATHLLKLLDKMYKYEMDPTRTVEATERTRDAGRTRDGRTDGRTEWNQYTPQQLRITTLI